MSYLNRRCTSISKILFGEEYKKSDIKIIPRKGKGKYKNTDPLDSEIDYIFVEQEKRVRLATQAPVSTKKENARRKRKQSLRRKTT